MRALVHAVAIGCLTLGPVLVSRADPPIHAGAQPVPPMRVGEPPLRQELDGRRAIRGCATDERCARPGDLLREFEVEAFPPPGASPWLDERTAVSRLEPAARSIVRRPSELRPDAPWLDKLELPDLPVRWSQTLVDYLVFYKEDPRGRSIMTSWLVAQGRYRELILAHLRKARLPEDLLYVAMIESGYDPADTSSAGALGLWQFMPEGGRIYGLREDRWVDERRDPLRSTIAQMDYFADLYQRFADWHVALAAFNMGYGAMLRSIARYNTNDYYRLCQYENAIPWETCLYTPKVLAAAIVGHNRAFYGYDKLAAAPAEAWDEVAVPTSVSLAALARVAGVNEGEVRRLNPHLRHGRTPPGEAGYVVRLPLGRKAEAQRRLVELEADWKGYDAYVIAHGERFEDVATTFGISVAQLRKLNDVAREAEIEGGTVLVVPRISAEQRVKNQARARANLHASGVDQKDGEPLLVPVPDKDATVAGKRRVFYRVVAGDTLRAVSRALGVKASELAQWNAIEADGNLHPRMVLVAWVEPGLDAAKRGVNLLDEDKLLVVTRGSPEHMDLAEARTGRVRTEYVAQGKEKLADVARKFGMGSHDLARINRISYDTVLSKGQSIIVYQVSDPSRSKRADEQWRKTPRGRRGKLVGARAAGAASAAEPDTDAADEGRADGEGEPSAAPGETGGDADAGDGARAPDRRRSEAEPDKPDAKRAAGKKHAADVRVADERRDGAQGASARSSGRGEDAEGKRGVERARLADAPSAKRTAERAERKQGEERAERKQGEERAERKQGEERTERKQDEERAERKQGEERPRGDAGRSADRVKRDPPRSPPHNEAASDGPVTNPAQLP